MDENPPPVTGRVTGIGGFFFKCKDPEGIARWYHSMLGIALTPKTYDEAPWRTQGGTTVFEPFAQDTAYFGDPSARWMINFRVDDLDCIVARLREAGHTVEYEGDGEAFPNGRFAKLHDPEGNAIQLWEPGGKDPG
ncbi:MAG: VOC family protein [Pseudomonadota bacterium]